MFCVGQMVIMSHIAAHKSSCGIVFPPMNQQIPNIYCVNNIFTSAGWRNSWFTGGGTYVYKTFSETNKKFDHAYTFKGNFFAHAHNMVFEI